MWHRVSEASVAESGQWHGEQMGIRVPGRSRKLRYMWKDIWNR